MPDEVRWYHVSNAFVLIKTVRTKAFYFVGNTLRVYHNARKQADRGSTLRVYHNAREQADRGKEQEDDKVRECV